MKDNLYKYQFDLLRQEISRQKPIILYLGAGVNCSPSCNMSWPSLLNHLEWASGINEYERLQLTEFDNELKTAIIKRRLGVGYIHAIQEFLYSRCNRTVLWEAYEHYKTWKATNCREGLDKVPFYSLFVLADVVVNCNCVKAVVTQNYDGFLSYAINLLQQDKSPDSRKVPVDVYDGTNLIFTKKEAINIYHVHGFIPAPDEVIPNEKVNHIVLSQDETHDMLRNVFSWQTGTQIHFFTHYTVLLLGLSLKDMTTLRLISFVNANHKTDNIFYFTACSNSKQQFEIKNNLSHEYYNGLGINVIYNSQGYSDLYYDLSTTLNN